MGEERKGVGRNGEWWSGYTQFDYLLTYLNSSLHICILAHVAHLLIILF